MLKFEKVSKESYVKAVTEFSDNQFLLDYRKECYDDIILPKRATECSAGYDFYAPYGLCVEANRWYTMPLGVKYVTDRKDIFLMLVPRSGLGFKTGLRLRNTCGIIDADYQFANNEGQIMVKFRTEETITIEKGQPILQGIFTTYIKVDDDNVEEKRVGGFGSTSVSL